MTGKEFWSKCLDFGAGGDILYLFSYFQFIREGDPSANWLIYKGPSI